MVRGPGRPGDTPRDDGTNEEPEFQFKKCHEFSIILFQKLQNVIFMFYFFFSAVEL